MNIVPILVMIMFISLVIAGINSDNKRAEVAMSKTKVVCYKPTFKDAQHTWHVIPCPFKGI